MDWNIIIIVIGFLVLGNMIHELRGHVIDTYNETLGNSKEIDDLKEKMGMKHKKSDEYL